MGATTCQTISYPTGDTGTIVCNYGTAEQAVVKGLTKIGPPGVSRGVIEHPELGTDFSKKFAGSGVTENMTAEGALVIGDLQGQQLLARWMIDKKEIKGPELLMFLNDEHFYATDLGRDCTTRLLITQAKVGPAGKDQLYPFNFEAVSTGPVALFTAHIREPDSSSDLAFVAGSGGADDTITDSSSRFVTAGFREGMSLLIINSTTNDQVYTTVKSVAAGTLTLNTQGIVTAEAGANGMELHGGEIR